jgi:hypothetical protein
MAFSKSGRSHRRGAALLAVALGAPALMAFTGGFAAAPHMRLHESTVIMEAGETSSSVALVKVNEQNSITTAGVIGGLAGLLVGGVWVGGALFAVSSYLARKKEDDVAAGLKGVAAGGLEALNFVDYLNNKYEVTGKLGSAISGALESATSGSDSKDSVNGFLSSAKTAIENFDKDVGIKDTLGGILTAGSELAAQAIDKAVELNKEYKLTDQLADKIKEATASAK